MPYLQPLSKDMLKCQYDEINTNEELLQRDIKTLIDWVEKQPHLPNFKDEQFFKGILLTCKNRMEKAKKHIDFYFIAKATMPEYLIGGDVNSISFKHFYNVFAHVPMPTPTPDGCRILICDVDCKNPSLSHVTQTDYIKGMVLLNLMTICFTEGKKFIVICNVSNINTALVSLITPIFKKFMYISYNILPARASKIYLVNISSVLQPFISILDHFNKGDKIEFWNGEKKDLSKILPKEILPTEYGGDEKPLNELKEMWYAELKNFNSWINDSDKYVADMTKKLKNESGANVWEEFGLEGSFRSLSID